MEKGDIVPFGQPPHKRVKRGHLSSDYRQKCVNATCDILMSKARKMTILTITMFNENVHTGCLLSVRIYLPAFRGVPVKKDTLYEHFY